jgi:hypothetical protein
MNFSPFECVLSLFLYCHLGLVPVCRGEVCFFGWCTVTCSHNEEISVYYHRQFPSDSQRRDHYSERHLALPGMHLPQPPNLRHKIKKVFFSPCYFLTVFCRIYKPLHAVYPFGNKLCAGLPAGQVTDQVVPVVN